MNADATSKEIQEFSFCPIIKTVSHGTDETLENIDFMDTSASSDLRYQDDFCHSCRGPIAIKHLSRIGESGVPCTAADNNLND